MHRSLRTKSAIAAAAAMAAVLVLASCTDPDEPRPTPSSSSTPTIEADPHVPAEYQDSLDEAWVVQADQIFSVRRGSRKIVTTGNYVAYVTSPTMSTFRVVFIDATTGKTVTTPDIPAVKGLAAHDGDASLDSSYSWGFYPLTLDGNPGVALVQGSPSDPFETALKTSLIAVKDGKAQIVRSSQTPGIGTTSSIQVVDNGISYTSDGDVVSVRTTGDLVQDGPELTATDPDPMVQVYGRPLFSLDNRIVYRVGGDSPEKDLAMGSWRLSSQRPPLNIERVNTVNDGKQLLVRFSPPTFEDFNCVSAVLIVDVATGTIIATAPGLDDSPKTSPNGQYVAVVGGSTVNLGDGTVLPTKAMLWSISDDGVAWATAKDDLATTKPGSPFEQQDNPVAVRIDHATGQATQEDGVLIPIGFTTDGTAIFYSPALGTIQGHQR